MFKRVLQVGRKFAYVSITFKSHNLRYYCVHEDCVQQNRYYSLRSNSNSSSSPQSQMLLKGKSNHEIGGKILDEILSNFDQFYSQILSKNGDANSVDPLTLIYFPRAFIVEKKIDKFVSSSFWPIWWQMLKRRLQEVEDTSFTTDLFFTFAKLNRDTSGDFLKNFGWENVQFLADIALRDVKSLYAKKFETFLHVLEQTVLLPEKEKPTEWLNTNLYNGFNAWVRLQYTDNQSIMLKSMAGKHMGHILLSLCRMNVRKPSENCLKMLTKICAHCSNVGENANYNPTVIVAFNLNRIGEAFSLWNVNCNDYCSDFWKNWFQTVNYLQRMTLTPSGSLTMTLLVQSFKIMLQFGCVEEFRKFKEQWGQLVKFNADRFPLDVVTLMLSEIEKIRLRDNDNVYQLISRDVIYMLEKRLEHGSNG